MAQDKKKKSDCGEMSSSDVVRTALIDGVNFYAKAVEYSEVDGMAMFEGDIILGSVDQVDKKTEIRRKELRGEIAQGVVITGATYRWPNCVIPYDIDSGLPNQARVTDAIAHWEANTRVSFVLRTSANASTYPDWVHFQPSTGCSSYVGRQGGQQPINLAGGCTTGNTIHEIGHAVGLWHEQSRADRDTFVTIHWDKIQAGRAHNFNQHITDGDDVGAYDYGSLMHYPRTAFSIDGSDTITPTDPTAVIGQRTGLSATDIATANSLCPAPICPPAPVMCPPAPGTCPPAAFVRCPPAPRIPCPPAPFRCPPSPWVPCPPAPRACPPAPFRCPPSPWVPCPPAPRVPCPPAPRILCPPAPRITCAAAPRVLCPPSPRMTCPPAPRIACPPAPRLMCPPAPRRIGCPPAPDRGCWAGPYMRPGPYTRPPIRPIRPTIPTRPIRPPVRPIRPGDQAEDWSYYEGYEQYADPYGYHDDPYGGGYDDPYGYGGAGEAGYDEYADQYGGSYADPYGYGGGGEDWTAYEYGDPYEGYSDYGCQETYGPFDPQYGW